MVMLILLTLTTYEPTFLIKNLINHLLDFLVSVTHKPVDLGLLLRFLWDGNEVINFTSWRQFRAVRYGSGICSHCQEFTYVLQQYLYCKSI